MRADLVRVSEDNPAEVFRRCVQKKSDHMNTNAVCEVAGFRFCPLVFEAHAGGWSMLARSNFDWLARQSAATTHVQTEFAGLRIAQRISAALQRESARAVLKRTVRDEGADPPSGWTAQVDPW